MLTEVNFSCGHKAEVNLSNNEQKRLEKIAELELNGLCPECRKAEWEAEDKENGKGCVCARTSVELYQSKFSHCKERLTGYPKEKDFTYIFVPIDELIVETFRKYIEVFNVPFEEMLDKVTNEFSEKYPELYNKLRPVPVDDNIPSVETEPEILTEDIPAEKAEISETEADIGINNNVIDDLDEFLKDDIGLEEIANMDIEDELPELSDSSLEEFLSELDNPELDNILEDINNEDNIPESLSEELAIESDASVVSNDEPQEIDIDFGITSEEPKENNNTSSGESEENTDTNENFEDEFNKLLEDLM